MSYRVQFTVKNGTVGPQENRTQGLSKEANDALENAIRAADSLVWSGYYGEPSEVTLRVNVSGHSNPGYKPAQGWANDHVTINIVQVSDGT